MSFPIPQQSTVGHRSVAERDRFAVLVAPIVAMLPIGMLFGQMISNLPLLWLTTFLVCFALAATMAYTFRWYRLATFVDASLAVCSTNRSLGTKAKGQVSDFAANGFALTDVVAVTDDEGRVLTRPLALTERTRDRQLAICSDMGSQLVTVLNGDDLLLTASHPVIPSDNVYVQQGSSTAEIIAKHDEAVATIERRLVRREVDAKSALLSIERAEQQAVRRVGGVHHRKLMEQRLEHRTTAGEWISERQSDRSIAS